MISISIMLSIDGVLVGGYYTNDLSVVDWNSTNTLRIGLWCVYFRSAMCYCAIGGYIKQKPPSVHSEHGLKKLLR